VCEFFLCFLWHHCLSGQQTFVSWGWIPASLRFADSLLSVYACLRLCSEPPACMSYHHITWCLYGMHAALYSALCMSQAQHMSQRCMWCMNLGLFLFFGCSRVCIPVDTGCCCASVQYHVSVRLCMRHVSSLGCLQLLCWHMHSFICTIQTVCHLVEF
jgi:hypothetical protein